MRILHTSDWHLGRTFYGIQLTDDQAYVLEDFIRLVQDTRPDAVLIAGDIYDRSVPPIEAVRLLDEVLSRILIDYRVPIILIAGNHDSPDRLGFGQRLLALQDLHVVGQLERGLSPVVIADSAGPVYFCPLPFAEPALVDAVGPGSAKSRQPWPIFSAFYGADSSWVKGSTVVIAHAAVAGVKAVNRSGLFR